MSADLDNHLDNFFRENILPEGENPPSDKPRRLAIKAGADTVTAQKFHAQNEESGEASRQREAREAEEEARIAKIKDSILKHDPEKGEGADINPDTKKILGSILLKPGAKIIEGNMPLIDASDVRDASDDFDALMGKIAPTDTDKPEQKDS